MQKNKQKMLIIGAHGECKDQKISTMKSDLECQVSLILMR